MLRKTGLTVSILMLAAVLLVLYGNCADTRITLEVESKESIAVAKPSASICSYAATQTLTDDIHVSFIVDMSGSNIRTTFRPGTTQSFPATDLAGERQHVTAHRGGYHRRRPEEARGDAGAEERRDVRDRSGHRQGGVCRSVRAQHQLGHGLRREEQLETHTQSRCQLRQDGQGVLRGAGAGARLVIAVVQPGHGVALHPRQLWRGVLCCRKGQPDPGQPAR